MVDEFQILMGGMEDLHDGWVRHHRREWSHVRAKLAVERAAHAVRAGHLHDGEMRTEGGAPDELRVERGHAARDERVAGILQIGRIADETFVHGHSFQSKRRSHQDEWSP